MLLNSVHEYWKENGHKITLLQHLLNLGPEIRNKNLQNFSNDIEWPKLTLSVKYDSIFTLLFACRREA